jgi:hypothetical protein
MREHRRPNAAQRQAVLVAATSEDASLALSPLQEQPPVPREQVGTGAEGLRVRQDGVTLGNDVRDDFGRQR